MRAEKTSPLLSCLILSTAICLVGCGDKGDKPSDSSPAPTQAKAPVTMEGVQQTAPVVAPPPSAGTAAIMPKKDDGVHESAPADADAKERIEAALQSYVIDNMANPSSLEELVQKKYLRSLPAAPAGKKWSYNTDRLAVELVDK